MRIGAALVASVFAWFRAIGGREACMCKLGVSLVRGMIGGVKGAWCHVIASRALGTWLTTHAFVAKARGIHGKKNECFRKATNLFKSASLFLIFPPLV